MRNIKLRKEMRRTGPFFRGLLARHTCARASRDQDLPNDPAGNLGFGEH